MRPAKLRILPSVVLVVVMLMMPAGSLRHDSGIAYLGRGSGCSCGGRAQRRRLRLAR